MDMVEAVVFTTPRLLRAVEFIQEEMAEQLVVPDLELRVTLAGEVAAPLEVLMEQRTIAVAHLDPIVLMYRGSSQR
jgi:hypothetical protein